MYQTLNPSRSGDGLNFATTYLYDGLGRVKSVTTADNAVAKTAYVGNSTTATDQAGNERTTWSDGLGRLAQVEEDPITAKFVTIYGYDTLDDLVC